MMLEHYLLLPFPLISVGKILNSAEVVVYIKYANDFLKCRHMEGVSQSVTIG